MSVKIGDDLVDNEAAIWLMDDDIREKLHLKYVEKVTDQEFIDLYCIEHFKKFGDEFVVN